MAFKQIRGALVKAATDWASAYPITLYTENRGGGDVPPTAMYVRLDIPRSGVFAGDFDGKKRTHMGNMAFVVSCPQNVATGALDDLMDSLDTAFPVNRRMVSAGGPTVEITGPVDPSVASIVGDRYMVTLFIPWRAGFYL